MYKVLLVLALLLSTDANATTWKLVDDGAKSGRLLVDPDSAGIDKYDKNAKGDGTRVHAIMRFVNTNGELLFVGVIDAGECIAQQGGTLVNIFEDNSSKTYFWSDSGERLYDSEGRWLCGHLLDTLETMIKQEPKSKSAPKIYM